MIYSYDQAVLKRETCKLEKIESDMRQQALVLWRCGQADLAKKVAEQADRVAVVIEDIKRPPPKINMCE